jgi:putative transposase
MSLMSQETAFSDLAAWHSRGYIPHFDRPGVIQSITFRLADAVPEKVIAQWKLELSWTNGIHANDPRNIALLIRLDKYEDAGHGACLLRQERIAAMVQNTILFHDGERYRLIAWCIMPNHVHTVIEVLEGWSLERILHSWKSYSVHKANKILRLSGRFWFPEYFDRFIRNPEHLERAIEYCENNPVRAGLVATKSQWKWSSAYLQARTPALPD